MIDIHSHLIFGVDDGSSCLEESIRMIEAAGKNNIRTIIATPHFQTGIFSNDGVLEKYLLLVKQAENYHVELRLGNEIFADHDIFNLIRSKDSPDFDPYRYLLLELPYNASFDHISKLLCQIAAFNIKVIIAHPERNRKIMKRFHEFIALTRHAHCLLQVDAGSIVGVYGSSVKKDACQLLKIKAADFIASNAHCSNDYSIFLPAAIRKIRRLCDEEYVVKLLESNAQDLIAVQGSACCYGREIG